MCGAVDFVGISLPRCSGSAPRLLGRVRRLLRLGSSERFVGDVWSGSRGGFVGMGSVVPLARLEWRVMFIQKMHRCIVMFVCVTVTCCVVQCLVEFRILSRFHVFHCLKLPKPFQLTAYAMEVGVPVPILCKQRLSFTSFSKNLSKILFLFLCLLFFSFRFWFERFFCN